MKKTIFALALIVLGAVDSSAQTFEKFMTVPEIGQSRVRPSEQVPPNVTQGGLGSTEHPVPRTWPMGQGTVSILPGSTCVAPLGQSPLDWTLPSGECRILQQQEQPEGNPFAGKNAEDMEDLFAGFLPALHSQPDFILHEKGTFDASKYFLKILCVGEAVAYNRKKGPKVDPEIVCKGKMGI